MSGASPHTGAVPFWTAFRFWLKLGFISFGGPAGQIAVMHTELVERKHWISERRFLHALNYCMVLPGPEAMQLAVYIGWLLHGAWGGIAAGMLFILPSVFILMALSWVYVAHGHVTLIDGLFYGMKSAVVAVVVYAVVRIGRRSIRNPATLLLAAGAFAALTFTAVPFPLILLSAAAVGLAGSRLRPAWFTLPGAHEEKKSAEGGAVIDDDHAVMEHTKPRTSRLVLQTAAGLALWAGPLGLLWLWQGWDSTLTQMAWFFTQAALLTFGGAYAVLPFVSRYAIEVYGWLRPGQMIDGLALGETTPGPLIMVVAFVGFVGGWRTAEMGWTGAVLGCLVAAYFTFLPSFLFIFLGGPFIEKTRGELRLTAVLTGITAAVVGVILNLAAVFGEKVFLPQGAIDGWAIAMSLAALTGLWRFKIGIIPVTLACGLAGLVLRLLGV